MRALASPISSPLPWPLRPRHMACLVLLVPLLAVAQDPIAVDAADAARPDAPTAPLTHRGLVLEPPAGATAPSPPSWRQAHEAVAAFPRGHADIVAWEARQGAQAASPANATSPHAPADHGTHKSSHGSHGSKPKNHSHQPYQGGKP